MAYKRLLTGLFICLFSFLLMSHNASALSFGAASELTYNATSSAFVYYSNNADAILTNYGTNNQGSVAFGFPREIGYVTRFVVQLSGNTGGKGLVNIPYRMCFANPSDMIAWIGFSGNGYTSVVSNSTQYTASGCISGDLLVYLPYSVNNIYLGGGSNGIVMGSFNNGGSLVLGKATFISLSDDADYSSVLNAIKNNTDAIKNKLDEIAESADAALDREQSETQDAADNSSSAGSSASTQSEQATSSLLSTITGFFNAIIGVNPSNCKFNSNLPFLPVNGEIDLCSISTPPIVQTLSSLVLVGLFIPFCIHMFNRFVSITESFQR